MPSGWNKSLEYETLRAADELRLRLGGHSWTSTPDPARDEWIFECSESRRRLRVSMSLYSASPLRAILSGTLENMPPAREESFAGVHYAPCGMLVSSGSTYPWSAMTEDAAPCDLPDYATVRAAFDAIGKRSEERSKRESETKTLEAEKKALKKHSSNFHRVYWNWRQRQKKVAPRPAAP